MKSLRGTWWGAHPRSLLQIYKTMIRSTMDYRCFAFPYNDYFLMKKLDQIQLKVLRICLGLRKTIPNNVILAESGEGPLDCRFYFLTSRLLLKTFSLNSHPVLNKLFFLRYYARKFIPLIIFFFLNSLEISSYKSRIALTYCSSVHFTDY